MDNEVTTPGRESLRDDARQGTCDFCLSGRRPVVSFAYEDGMAACEECYRAMEEADRG